MKLKQTKPKSTMFLLPLVVAALIVALEASARTIPE